MYSFKPESARHPEGAPPMSLAPSPPPLAFDRIPSRRTFEEICDQIRARIDAGELRPGDKLPAERDLAVQLGVGRNAVREALRSLEIAGMLELRKGVKGGAFIRNGDPGRMDAVVRDMFSLGSITIDELAEAREHVQDLAVRLVCERATEEDLHAMAANIDRTEAMTKAGNYLDRVECSREFYRLLGTATGNGVLAMMMQSITEILMQFVYARVAAGGPPQPRLVAVRREFLDAVRAHDAETAVRLMRAHLQSVHLMLRDSLDGPRLAAGKAGKGEAKATKAVTGRVSRAAR